MSIDDESAQLAELAKTYGVRFPIVWEADRRTTLKYRPATDPATYVIDREGIIRYRHAGYHDGEAEAIEDEAKSLLARAARGAKPAR